ncbi:hypothetical protein BJY17_000796 [Agromyces hippuratus]|uniref:Uncharacterized protein n=2 Tax=Agromyces hippuratus TaxID=286438 RepID=A0A852WPZ1_9MICO|nr:hypothetical protein [Agromyces hippuratus]NYG20049.1 hypothetical protein [Agromyces hippuratus]
MELSAIRSLARPRRRSIRRTILSALGMAAIVLGLLAMHSFGAEHAPAPQLSAATAHAADSGHGEGDEIVAAATSVVASITATAVQCDAACMHGVLDCALMIMTCAMIIAVAALIVFSRGPVIYRKIFDAGTLVIGAASRIPLPIHRPDLTVLSISRT